MLRLLTLHDDGRTWFAIKSLFLPKHLEKSRSIERYRRIILAAVSNIANRLILSVVGIVSVALTINYLGKEQFGLWMVVSSLIIWLQLADLGFSNGLTNALSEAYGNDDRDSASAYITTVIIANFLIALLLVIPFAFLSFSLPWGLVVNTDDKLLTQLAAQCFFTAGLVFILSLPIAVINRILTAYQLGYVPNITQALGSILSLIVLVGVIHWKLELPYLVLAMSLGPVFSYLLSWFLLSHYLPWYAFKINARSMRALKRVMQTSVPLFLFQFGSLIINQMVNILLVQVGTLTLVADYNVVLKIYMFIFTIGACFSLPFYPAIREAFERKEYTWVKKAITRAVWIRFSILLLMSSTLPMVGNWLILVWVNKPLDNQFGFYGWISLIICMLLAAYSATKGDILIHLDVISEQLKVIFIAGAVVLAGICYLVPILGLPAVFISMALSTLHPIWWLSMRLRRQMR
jgi:O-antigen/teichoic acid export membrane protein